ncbi:MAG: C40 family peptidase [Burkholderiales bacterium]|nr:C40 family peptidase [Burkholderiales bacterium]
MSEQKIPTLPNPNRRRFHAACLAALFLVACSSKERGSDSARFSGSRAADLPPTEKGREVVFYALSLLDTGYRFGGKNPQAGFDCSGMVSYIYAQAAGVKVSGSAADIARQGTSVGHDRLRPGDLVFFNTLNRPFSHVGIYIGDNRFIHAPSTDGKVRIDDLGSRYFSERFEEARAYFD